MRAQVAVFLVLAAGVAGCASTPPPPPAMAAIEPAPPPPAPVMTGPVNGVYKGAVAATDDSSPRCRKMPAMATTRVRNDRFVLGGMHAKVGPDGNVMGMAHRGATVTGMLANGSLDVTTMSHGCGYHYTLARS